MFAILAGFAFCHLSLVRLLDGFCDHARLFLASQLRSFQVFLVLEIGGLKLHSGQPLVSFIVQSTLRNDSIEKYISDEM